MSLLGSIRDHVMIGGPNAIAGWGLLILLVFSRGFIGGRLMPGLDPFLFALVLLAAVFTGNGVYALNAYYDAEADSFSDHDRLALCHWIWPKRMRIVGSVSVLSSPPRSLVARLNQWVST